METIVTSADGTKLVTRRRGHGPAVVLVHGSSGGLHSWDPIVPLLEDTYELWVYARRGYAPSDSCIRPKSYADDVTDLRAVIAATGGPAHVVGGSYGATVALHAALDPGAIDRVALFEPPLFTDGVTDVLGPYRELLEAGDLAAAQRLFAERVARVPAAILAALGDAPVGARDELVGCLHDLEAMAADSGDLGRWAAVGLPTLILRGGETWAPMPATMDALAEVMPSAEQVTLAGQSHFATHTAPEVFAAELTRFLSRERTDG